MSECIGKLRLAHPATHFLSHSLVHSLILQLTNWLTHLPTYRVTHWLTNCLTHHLLGHSPIQSLNRLTATRVTHRSSNPFFHSSIHLKQLDTWIKKTPEYQRHLFTTHCCAWWANHSAMTHPWKISYESPVIYKYTHIRRIYEHIHPMHNLNPGTQTSIPTLFLSQLLPECIYYVFLPAISRDLHLKHTQVAILVSQLHSGHLSLSTRSWHLNISPIMVPSDVHPKSLD